MCINRCVGVEPEAHLTEPSNDTVVQRRTREGARRATDAAVCQRCNGRLGSVSFKARTNPSRSRTRAWYHKPFCLASTPNRSTQTRTSCAPHTLVNRRIAPTRSSRDRRRRRARSGSECYLGHPGVGRPAARTRSRSPTAALRERREEAVHRNSPCSSRYPDCVGRCTSCPTSSTHQPLCCNKKLALQPDGSGLEEGSVTR
jgi:hypothetical protein